MANKSLFLILTLLGGILVSNSCKKAYPDQDLPLGDSAYFSIRQFMADQIKTYYGVPHGLCQINHEAGHTDTAFVNFVNMDWKPVLKAFDETDISARKFLGKYDFSITDDDITGYRGLIYTARTPEVETRLLQINTDPSNNRITSIYIETARRSMFGDKSQKLLYVPLRIIQIQQTEGQLFGKARNLRIDYKFLGADKPEL